jgi:hypothetical protein
MEGSGRSKNMGSYGIRTTTLSKREWDVRGRAEYREGENK